MATPLNAESVHGRKVTRSCLECRQRKVKCIWPDDADACRPCLERRRTCIPQVVALRDNHTGRITSRDRIAKLESTVAQLSQIVRRLEGNASTPSTYMVTDRHAASGRVNAAPDDEQGSESDSSDLSPVNPPTHLRQLFEDGPLDFSDRSPMQSAPHAKQHTSGSRLHRASTVLRQYMPSREDVATISAHAAHWLMITRALFIMPYGANAESELLPLWDQVQDPDAHPASIAVLLLSFVMSLQQLPVDEIPELSKGPREGLSYIRQVSDAIETTIVMNDSVAATMEGLEASLLWLRLQLVQTRIQKVWICLRRVIALAELIGLPRAVLQQSPSERSTTAPTPLPWQQDRSKRAAELWMAICSIDKLAGMMFNLPQSTILPNLLREPVVNGRVNHQAYLSRLSDIASGIQEVDNQHARGLPPPELCEKVLRIDGQLRTLAGSLPTGWWQLDTGTLSPDQVIGFFHQYITIRSHVHLALKNQDSNQFMYSDLVCTEACRDLARRYAVLRGLLPKGFFACRIIDLQALTAAIFLLIKQHNPGNDVANTSLNGRSESTTSLIEEVVKTMDAGSKAAAGRFARESAQAIRAVAALLNSRDASGQHSLSLQVPLLGRIDVRRKARGLAAPILPQQHEPAGSWKQAKNGLHAQAEAAEPLLYNNEDQSWLMEISSMPAFLSGDGEGGMVAESWLQWEGLD
ncbi:hypothetical protein LTR17_012403 [Elasticomyces elasticus]|nr:hypothetical protein LTR17_012403 [Elasticomyces elasticus]